MNLRITTTVLPVKEKIQDLQSNRRDMEEAVRNMKIEERGIAQVETSKQNGEEISTNNNIHKQKNSKDLLNGQPISPLFTILNFRCIERIGMMLSMILFFRSHFFHLTSIHIDRIR